MRLVATSLCGVMARQIHQSNTAPNAAELFLESLQKEESKIKGVLPDRMWPTLCVTTATLQVNIEGQPITPATSSYG